MSRIGIFSGSFDPLHEGHILFAHLVKDQFAIDHIVFMPNPSPAHKPFITDIQKRIDMINIRLEGETDMDVLTTSSESHSSIATLAEIRRHYPIAALTMLMGADVFSRLSTWKDYQRLVGECDFIIAIKTVDDEETVNREAELISAEVEMIETPLKSISSTQIRDDIKNNHTPRGLDDRVYDYIKANNLYVGN